MECQELFLSDIVRVQVYQSSQVSFSLPSTIHGITTMAKITWPKTVLDVSYDSDKWTVRENGIKVKQTTKPSGSRLLYIYNVEMAFDSDISDISALLPTMQHVDHVVLLTKADGSMLLLYTLPGAFSVDGQNTLSEGSLSLSVSSINNFISVTD